MDLALQILYYLGHFKISTLYDDDYDDYKDDKYEDNNDN